MPHLPASSATLIPASATTTSLTANIQEHQLDTLPSEILLLVFNNLDECASVCAGLTCRKLYRMHRLTYNHPANLYAQSPLMFLYHHIERWMGDRYRWSECFEVFVNKEVFGEGDREEECGRLVRVKS
jgi:hypothetical protein